MVEGLSTGDCGEANMDQSCGCFTWCRVPCTYELHIFDTPKSSNNKYSTSEMHDPAYIRNLLAHSFKQSCVQGCAGCEHRHSGMRNPKLLSFCRRHSKSQSGRKSPRARVRGSWVMGTCLSASPQTLFLLARVTAVGVFSPRFQIPRFVLLHSSLWPLVSGL